jgi:hypothetical protein
MFPNSSAAPDRFRILDAGRNRAVSAANHVMVLVIAAASVWLNPSIFRRMPLFRAPDRT